MQLVGSYVAYILGMIEALVVWLIGIITIIVKVLLSIFVLLFLLNVHNGYQEASEREAYEKWFRSLGPEQQLMLSSLSPEHKEVLARQTPRFRQWFLSLSSDQRNDYLLRQKV
jgi:hypothetical protein